MAKLRLLKTGHGDLTLAEWDRITQKRSSRRKPRSLSIVRQAASHFASTGRVARLRSASLRNRRPRF